ncbi:hypothetical protein ZWY2020_005824 [Hordeum vulgare]|nr:hypothetical protein ZWY2020_005824 [Hordeum vulgare]
MRDLDWRGRSPRRWDGLAFRLAVLVLACFGVGGFVSSTRGGGVGGEGRGEGIASRADGRQRPQDKNQQKTADCGDDVVETEAGERGRGQAVSQSSKSRACVRACVAGAVRATRFFVLCGAYCCGVAGPGNGGCCAPCLE